MTDEILSLQDKMKCLEKENQYLKSNTRNLQVSSSNNG